MLGIDRFAATLLEQAKRFFEKAKSEAGEEGKRAYLNAALLIGVCALEAHVNAVADEMLLRDDLSILERSILLEKDVALENGELVPKEQLKMYRLRDRMLFIYHRFSGKPLDRTSQWWCQLMTALRTRNDLVHPKDPLVLTEEMAETALQAILDSLDALYMALYKTHYPALGRRLDSSMIF